MSHRLTTILFLREWRMFFQSIFTGRDLWMNDTSETLFPAESIAGVP